MLEGLEAREELLSKTIENKDFRLDSQFHTQAPKKNPNLHYKRIGDILKLTQYGISIEMNESNIGYPIYRMNEIHEMLCDLEVDKCADISIKDYQRFALQNRDVLFNRTNSYEWVGRTGVYYQNDDTQRTFASYLVKLIPDENIILPEYLCTFLNSKYGVRDIKRRARQSINQTNVNPEEVKEIEIPILEMNFQKQIQVKFETANSNRLESHTLYAEAESILLDELGVKSWHIECNPINIKQLKESFLKSGRLDAEYYQPKYDALSDKLSQFKHNTIAEIATTRKSIEPGSNAYQKKGVPFIRVSDMTKFGISEPSIYLSRKEYNLEELRPKKDTILLSKDGSVGIAYKAEIDLDCITSGALLHLNVFNKNYLPDYLTLVLNSIVVQLQAERDANGAVIQHWKPAEIERVVIPCLPMKIQQTITSKVQQSFTLRKEAKQLLEDAKKMIENEIGKN